MSTRTEPRMTLALPLPPRTAARIEGALTRVAHKHPALRNRFAERDGELEARLLDVGALPPWRATRAAGDDLARLRALAWSRPLEATETPYRALVATAADGAETLLVELHALVADARSAELFATALHAALTDRGAPGRASAQPATIAAAAAKPDLSAASGADAAWWRERLTAVAGALPFATSAASSPSQRSHATVMLERAPLRCLANAVEASPAATLLALVQTVQHAYAGGAPGHVATAVVRDTRGPAEGMAIGPYSDELPLLAAIDATTRFDALARAAEAELAACERLRTPAFAALVAHGGGHDPRRLLPPLRFDHRVVPATTPSFELLHDDGRQLHLQALERGEGITLRLDADSRQLAPAAARRMLELLALLLSRLTAAPTTRLAALELRTADERATAAARNRTAVPPPAWTVPERIAALARRQPSRLAVEDDGSALTYAQLANRAGAVAALVGDRPAGGGRRVGVLLERSADLVVTLLGVLAAGAVYVPLDPSLPRERLRFVADDAGLDAIVASERTAATAAELATNVLTLADAPAGAPLAAAARPQDEAYVIYTSGSTGRPKGVPVTHAALANFLADTARRPGIGADDAQAAVASPAFDLSLLDLLLPLTAGARCVVVAAEEAIDGAALARRLAVAGVTYLHVTPATWRLLLASGWQGRLRVAVSGAEALTPELAGALLARADELWNSYGPTETTIGSTLDRVRDADDVTIGRPIANTRVHLRDPLGREPPTGVPGELLIAGDGVARGYHRRPQLTATRFLPEPGDAGRRAYASGDLVRAREDGRLEYVGRIDDQVKVRGFRIELGEVEAALKAAPGVRDAVAAVAARSDADRRLVAWVVPDGASLDRAGLRSALRERLPSYMVPSLLVAVDALPLTANGKVDRAALPAPGPLGRGRAGDDPLTASIAAAMAETLGVASLAPDDSLFARGGDAATALRLLARLRALIGRDLSLQIVLDHPSPAAMAAALSAPSAATGRER